MVRRAINPGNEGFLTDSLARRLGHLTARAAQIPKLIVPGRQDWGVGSQHAGGNVGASPEPAVGVFTPAGTCPGRLWRHFVIGYADPGQNPSAVRFGSSRVRGRVRAGPGAVSWPMAGPTAVTSTRAPHCKALCHAHWNDRDPQARNRFCKPICKPDAAGQLETGETWKDRVDFAAQVGRGQRGDRRLLETGETRVVWLITQRSRVQIPPPLPNWQVRGLFRFWEGPSCCGVLTSLLTTFRPSDFPAVLTVLPGFPTTATAWPPASA